MRQAIWAGKFYEKGVNSLKRQIEECFLHEKGPGALPAKLGEEKLQAVIVPHAGYAYSGPAAAWAYKAIAEAEKPDFFIILAANHQSYENVTTMETYDMPFGFVRVEQDFARRLVQKGHLKVDDKAHQQEHSVEVQLPFLQHIYKEKAEAVHIVPILVGSDENIKELGVDIKEVLVETGKRAVIICSSDFTHYGRAYHYIPFSIDIQKNIYELDRQAIDLIKSKDAKGFLHYCNERMATICGANAIALLLYSTSPKKILLEQYYTSADITGGDYKNSVSYAAMVFR